MNGNSVNFGIVSVRMTSPNIPNTSINFNGYPQMNGPNNYNPNPINLVSPKAGPIYPQPPPNNAVLNRTF